MGFGRQVFTQDHSLASAAWRSAERIQADTLLLQEEPHFRHNLSFPKGEIDCCSFATFSLAEDNISLVDSILLSEDISDGATSEKQAVPVMAGACSLLLLQLLVLLEIVSAFSILTFLWLLLHLGLGWEKVE